MICPFCKTELISSEIVSMITNDPSEENSFCNNSNCMYEDMTRYIIVYNINPYYLIREVFILNDLYVKVYIKDNKTSIYRLTGSVIDNRLELKKAIRNDLINQVEAYNKYKTLLLLS